MKNTKLNICTELETETHLGPYPKIRKNPSLGKIVSVKYLCLVSLQSISKNSYLTRKIEFNALKHNLEAPTFIF